MAGMGQANLFLNILRLKKCRVFPSTKDKNLEIKFYNRN
jgi:hypothetical protein